MADGIKDTLKNAGQKVVDGVTCAATWAKEQVSGHAPMSAANVNDIKPHMDVVTSCGCKVGTVDHMEDGAIKLARKDSPDGQHHYLPTQWVARVDDHVHLNKDVFETKQNWKSDAAACANSSA